MYREYFRLAEEPFSIAPDPRFLYMSERYREALAHLLYGVRRDGGIVLLTGEVGTGKTTICRSLLEQMPPDLDVAFILNPRMNVEEMLATICDEYHLALPPAMPGTKVYIDAIYAHLLAGNASGRRGVVIIDEAQNLAPEVVEQLRLLTNLETNTRKLLQIILIGQPELRDLLAMPEMRQVAQRVVADFHLTHLSPTEVGGYVAHRLAISGAPAGLIPRDLIAPLARATGGIPRLINLVCDRALLGAYTQGLPHVDKTTLGQAIHEVVKVAPSRKRYMAAIAGVALIGVGALAATVALTRPSEQPKPVEAAAAEPVPNAAVVAPVAVQLVPKPLDPLTWPAGVSIDEGNRLAGQVLFGLHKLQLDPARAANLCGEATAFGMRCYAGQGGLAELRLLDQPALLRLKLPDASAAPVVLSGMEGTALTLNMAGQLRRVAIEDLANAWDGNFLVLWRPPEGFGNGLVPDQRSPAVTWLRDCLSRLDGRPAGEGTVYDAELVGRVRAFQLKEGLLPDGLVGSLTAIRLNARSGGSGPRITMSKAE